MKSYCFATLIEYLGFSSRSPRKVKSKEKATRKFFSHAFLCFISGEAAGNNGCGNLQPSKRREQKNLTREINIIKDFIPSSASFFQFKAPGFVQTARCNDENSISQILLVPRSSDYLK